MTTILHVEDDLELAETVRDYFRALGFHGTYLIAETLREAEQILNEPTRTMPIDLVISDMNLPDGSGLDLVRSTRANPPRAQVPIVVLSANAERCDVDHAYVLGANSYVTKGLRDRPITQVISALYTHWLKDVHLPSLGATNRTQQYVARAIRLRSRKASLDLKIAERLGSEDGAFWIDLALREGNIANLLAFVGRELGSRELPNALLDEAEAAQLAVSVGLDELEREPVRTTADAERYMRTIISGMRIGPVDRVIAQLFPNAPMAMTALREIAGAALEEMATWIEIHAHDSTLRGQVIRIRADAARIRTATIEADQP